MRTLKGRLILSYLLIALLIVISLGALFNLSIDPIFEKYAIQQQKKQIAAVLSEVDQLYLAQSGTYDMEGMEVVASAALQNGIMLHVRTTGNEIDWDVRRHKAQECQVLLQHAEKNMHSRYPNFLGGYVEEIYDLTYQQRKTGYLTVGYYGPYSLGDDELALIATLNRTLVLLGAGFLAGAMLLGMYMARRIVRPIAGVINTAGRIAQGNYGALTSGRADTRELHDLIRSINTMSGSLQTKEQQKKQIAADVAHELRTPLFNLQGNMEAMIDGILEPTPERLQNCHAEILRLVGIVEQLQELESLENQRAALNREYFDFGGLCISLFADFDAAARNKGVQLLSLMQDSSALYGDLYRIKQCLTNLLANALDHTGAGGSVTIEYSRAPGGAIIKVKDTGTGIAPQDLPHIFERFYRADKSRSRKSGSLGIGLSITKAIVGAHGGTIEVESQVKAGTVVSIFVPDYKNLT